MKGHKKAPFLVRKGRLECDEGKDCKRAFQSQEAACRPAGEAEGLREPVADGRGCGEDEIHRKK